MEGETVRDVAACTVDVQRDGFAALGGEFAQPLDDAPRDVFFDVPDEIDVPEAFRLFSLEQILDRVDQFFEQTSVQITDDCSVYLHAACRVRPVRPAQRFRRIRPASD